VYLQQQALWLGLFFSQIDDLGQLGRLDEFMTKELISRGLDDLRPQVKKFLRSYHEILCNLTKTNYVPKFDNLDISEIIKELAQAEGKPEEYYTSHLTEKEIRQKFTSLIDRQTKFLEKDLIEAIS